MKNILVTLLVSAVLALTATPVLAIATPTAAVEAAQVVNINTAGAAELQTLPGIGKATAEQIVQYRLENGRFSSTEELVRVKGVGPKTLEKIRALITIQ